ncbi:hypothetical protein DPMN_011066 [Dreissena polymorpha]|uniref:Uncharacterized protein n=1 Tax=Dreissena polymorpha TaxID=45954 RepID=A0A9D4S1K6_DREPO|nr:hypothetical protein DPMN_011066 [Dreissena polymorpha]
MCEILFCIIYSKQCSTIATWKQLPKKRQLQHSGLLALRSGGHYRSVKFEDVLKNFLERVSP